MSAIYEFFGISRQAHHQQQRRESQRRDLRQQLLAEVVTARLEHPRMGARKLFHLLGVDQMGINAFETMVVAAGLRLPRQRSIIRTTIRGEDGLPLSNLVQGLRLNDINQLWVSDLSYLIDAGSVYYLAHIMDVYSRRVLAIGISGSMRAEENLKLLHQSFRTRGTQSFQGLIHHSDAGAQYTSCIYRTALQTAGIDISIAQTCLQNAYSERLNATVKNEYLFAYVNRGLDLSRWQQQTQRTAHLYNYVRPHKELDYRTPVAFENDIASIPLNQRPILDLYDFTADNSTVSPLP
jgi:transposase InsO family protein